MQLNLSEILRRQEGEQLDYKQRVTSFEKIAKTICAFANTKGGMLLIGIKDDHTVTGVDPEEEKYMLEQAASNYCEPAVPLHYEEMEDEEGRTVLAVQIEESRQKPHSCRNNAGLWQVYVRQKDKSLPAGKHMIRHLSSGTHEQTLQPELALTKHEKSILQFVHVNEKITLQKLMILLNFSRRRAQRLLQEMVEKGLLRLFEHEKEDYYA
ncbi:transcriptional regulator [Flammeovirgaceae bacterium 311]|nr:transcriptional regulator [Flammeovirgaceae bacterium 311]